MKWNAVTPTTAALAACMLMLTSSAESREIVKSDIATSSTIAVLRINEKGQMEIDRMVRGPRDPLSKFIRRMNEKGNFEPNSKFLFFETVIKANGNDFLLPRLLGIYHGTDVIIKGDLVNWEDMILSFGPT